MYAPRYPQMAPMMAPPPPTYGPPIKVPSSSNKTLKIMGVLGLFVCIFGVLMMAMLAGSNPLSHKTSKNHTSMTANTSVNTQATANTTANASLKGHAGSGGKGGGGK